MTSGCSIDPIDERRRVLNTNPESTKRLGHRSVGANARAETRVLHFHDLLDACHACFAILSSSNISSVPLSISAIPLVLNYSNSATLYFVDPFQETQS